MIKAVVFDLDDTLFPELQYVESGFKAVAKRVEIDYKINCYDKMLQLFFENSKQVYNRVLDFFGVKYQNEYVLKLVEIYRNNKPKAEELNFYADVLSTIKRLKSLSLNIGIITDGRVEGQQAKLNALKCYDLFDEIVITDSLGGENYRKPNPVAFELLAKKFKISLSEMMYVGDNPKKDFFIKQRNVRTVRIERDNAINKNEDYLNGVKEDYFVDTLEEIFDFLN